MFCDMPYATVMKPETECSLFYFAVTAEGTSAVFQTFSVFLQDPSVLSVTRNAASGVKEFNPFEDQNSSQVSNGN